MPIMRWYSLISVIILASAYIFGERLERVSVRHPRKWISAAAGASIAYIFMDLLPDLAERQQIVASVSGSFHLPLQDYWVYASALAGFVIFYGLEYMVGLSHRDRISVRQKEDRELLIYWLHIGGFTAYSGLVSYLIAGGTDRTPLSLMLYTVAMTFHFLVVDRSLRNEHNGAYIQTGRWVLVAGIFTGWIIGVVTVLPELVLDSMLGFVAGGVVINSIKEELPKEGEGRFWAFVIGAIAYSVLIVIS